MFNKMKNDKKGVIELELDKLDKKDRANFKADLFSKCKIKTIKEEGLDLEIVSIEKVDNGIKVFIESKDKNVKLNNPYYFINPPGRVQDGTFKIIKVEGKDIEIANFKEDVDASFKKMIIEVIKRKN